MKTAKPLNTSPVHRKRAFVLMGGLVLIVFALLGYELWFSYRADIMGAETATHNYAKVIDVRLDAMLRRADAVLQSLVEEIPLATLSKQAVPQYRKQIGAELDSYLVNFEEVIGLRVFDAQGDLLYTSAPAIREQFNIADRGYFQTLRDKPKSGLVFSDVVTGRVTGRSVMMLGRALTDARGVFRGGVFAVVDLWQFQLLFESLHLGAGGLMAIRRLEDGRGIVRWPELAKEINQPLPPTTPIRQRLLAGQKEGTVEFPAVSDGTVRIYSFRALAQFPFYVSVGMSRQDVLADWRKMAHVSIFYGLSLLGVFLFLLYRLWFSEARESQARGDLQRSEERTRLLAEVFEHSGEAIMITDRHNRIVDVNPSFSRMTGYTLAEVRGQNPRILASGRTTRQEYEAMWRSVLATGGWQGEIWDRSKSGTIYPKWVTISVMRGQDGEVDHYIANFIDISARKAAEEKVAHQANHDALTGLPNRYSLESRLEQVLATARREETRVALLYLDMDRFKSINDTLGHHVGDGLLKKVAKRLRLSMRGSDVAARIGGDEFVAVLANVDVSAVEKIASNILQKLGAAYRVEGHELHSSPSIGIALFPDDAQDGAALLKKADEAMYRAKNAGRNRVAFFNPGLKPEAPSGASG